MSQIAITSWVNGSVLFSVEAGSMKAALENLGGANLRDANLRDADLGDGVKAKAALQVGPIDTWTVLLWSTSAGLRVQVGCHFFSLEQAEAHWRDKPDRAHLYNLVTEGWKTLVRLAGWEE